MTKIKPNYFSVKTAILKSILIITIMFLNLQAQNLPSQITNDTTLALANSPYHAEVSVSVIDGVKLTVEAGVEIKFAGGTSLTIQGECEMAGSSENPIKLIPLDSLVYWGGVKGSTGYINFNNVLLSGASTAYSINYGITKLHGCEVQNITGSDAIHINAPDTAIISSTYMLGDRGLSKQDAIDCDNAGQGLVLFENNTFAEYSDDAIDVGNHSDNVTIRGNKINHCLSMGITVGEGSNALVARNIVSNCNGGIEVHNNATALILNNTLYHNNTGIFGYHASDSGTPTSGATAEIVNTIISECQTKNFVVASNSSLEFLYSISDTDTLDGQGNLFEPVQFIDAGNGDYKLQVGSPCIDKGIQDTIILYNDGQDTLVVPTMTYLGSAPDMGAYEFEPSAEITEETDKPVKYILGQNYPNPFNPSTTIPYSLEVFQDVKLSIYNILGQKIATLVDKKQPAGEYQIIWNADGFVAGIYFYRLTVANSSTQIRKLILIK
jgi:parallel beta-helix repeat protein